MHNQRIAFAALLLLGLVLMAGCGPSEEEIAAMTASAATATPVPPTATPIPPTPTPLPYDLTVTVTDSGGSPIPDAQVALPVSGSPAPVPVDDAAQVVWNDLPRSEVSLTASAQGYVASEQDVTMEHGPNEVNVALERSPFAPLASEVCGPGESVFVIEDLEDGAAPGWGDLGFTPPPPGWTIAPDETGDTVVSITAEGVDRMAGHEAPSGNYVMRLRFRLTGEGSLNTIVNGQHDPATNSDTAYQVVIGTPGARNPTELRRIHEPESNNAVGRGFTPISQGTWYDLEVSIFDDTVQVFLNGELFMAYQDPDPLPSGAGSAGFGIFPTSPDVVLDVNNVALCELSQPFAPLFMPEAEAAT